MNRFLPYIPDEWISARRAFGEMWALSSKTARAGVKTLVGFALPFAVGMSLFAFGRAQLSVDFIQGLLTVMGVLCGFVVTQMLFTGSTEGTDVLKHAQARRYANKIFYLLFSQAFTLCCYLLTLVLAGAWLFISKGSPNATAQSYVAPFLYGSTAVSLVRTVLLPAQIYERHHFVIETMVEKKRVEEESELQKSEEELQEVRRNRH